MKFNKLLLVSIAILTLISCKKNEEVSNYISITGLCDIPKDLELTLSKIENGDKFKVASSIVNDKKEYGFNISPDSEGFYLLGTKWFDMPIYVKGNQSFKIDFDSKLGFIQKETPDEENRILDAWFHSNDTLRFYEFNRPGSKTYEEFFPFYENFMPLMKEEHKAVNSTNEKFNQLMHTLIDINIEYTALHFLFTPRIKHPTTEQMPAFYHEFMKGDNFKSALILDVPKGLRALSSHQTFKATHTGLKIDRKNFTNWCTTDIENDTLRAYYALGNLKKFKNYDKKYLDYIEPLRKDIALSQYVTKKVDEYELVIKTMDPGSQGYEFSYNDINGKKVSFSDFKGKYVLIDVWATWCAPCRKQMPALAELEKHFHSKNIEFVSISMDKPKDKEKWEKFVKDKGLGGVQLMSDNAFETRIAKDYKINSIPRFLLFDTEGKIIDADAKWPSDPELKNQLEKLL